MGETREMSLKEWMAKLPESHLANKEHETLEAERDELKAHVERFIECQKENYGNATNLHLAMIALVNELSPHEEG